MNGLKRTAHVMPKHSKQKIASLEYGLDAEKADGFRERLINGLVKPDDVIGMRRLRLTCMYPQAKNTGTKRTILSGRLVDIEAASRSQNGPRLRGCFANAISVEGASAINFFELGFLHLGIKQILRDSLQNLLRVIWQTPTISCQLVSKGGDGERFHCPRIVSMSRKMMRPIACCPRVSEKIL